MLRFNYFKENQLIQRIRDNDRRVLGELYVRNEKMITAHIVSRGGSAEDAQDILQESIIVLWQKAQAGDFKMTAKVSTFLMGIAKNKWLAELRKRKPQLHSDVDESLPDNHESVLSKLIADENVDRIRQALEIIQPLCRQILMMYYFEQRSMENIAQVLKLANANVAKSKKYQCKKALENVLVNLKNKIEGRI